MQAVYNLNENFINSTRRFSRRVAIEAKKDGKWERVTFKNLYEKTISLSHFLCSIGVKKSDRIAIILENRMEWPVVFFAIAYTGAVSVPIAPGTPHEDISLILVDSGASFVFIPEENSELAGFLKTISQIKKVITVPFETCWDRSASLNPAQIEQDGLAVLLYTSGTTQEPKGVMLTHKNLCANFNSIDKVRIFKKGDSMLSVLPLFHSYSLMTTLITPVFSGLKIIYVPSDWPEKLVEYMKEAKVSVLIGVPQIFSMMHSRMMKRLKELPKYFKPFVKILARKAFGPRFRFFVSGGAKLDEAVAMDFLNLGLKILEGYGLTETSPVVSINPLKEPRPGSCGKPVPDVQVDIINKDKEGIGEITIKGPNVMKGYYKDEAKTRGAFKDGWFLTGDLGYIDDNGYIHITGRSKEMIVLSSGKNIFPEEVERHYSRAAFVKEMCVFGAVRQKGSSKIEYLHGVIVLDEGFFKDCREGDIRKAVTERFEELGKELSAYKHITGFTIIKENLPRTALGKIKRYEVQNKYMSLILKEEGKKEGILSEEDRILAESDIARKVIVRIKEALGLKTEIKLSDSIELDLGADSLGIIELASGLEKCFGLNMDEYVSKKGVSTVKDLILKVKEMIEGKAGKSC